MGAEMVEVPAGRYELGQPGEARVVDLAPFGTEQQAGNVWEWVADPERVTHATGSG